MAAAEWLATFFFGHAVGQPPPRKGEFFANFLLTPRAERPIISPSVFGSGKAVPRGKTNRSFDFAVRLIK